MGSDESSCQLKEQLIWGWERSVETIHCYLISLASAAVERGFGSKAGLRRLPLSSGAPCYQVI